MEEKEFRHVPVLWAEVIEGLNIKADGIYVDGTLGGAGHASLICQRMKEKGILEKGILESGGTNADIPDTGTYDTGARIPETGSVVRFLGIDQDGDAVAAAGERLKPYPFATVVRSNYEAMPQIVKELGISQVDGILLDLGVSSYQFDTAERGFTYREDAPLDMRMDDRMEKTAKDIVNGYSEQELCRVLRDYGEEPFARNIARQIARRREKEEIATTFQLVDIVKAAIPAKVRKAAGHPAKRTFQALRIELNRELEVLQNTLDDMITLLAPGGRLCIITFHSLEDRIVKSKFRENEHPCICPPEFPVCVCGRKPKGTVVTHKPVLPGEEELLQNPRAKSAKLRIFERET